jgi:cellulose synthase/poly-beta-1,6-N-acetylglucosamine synthase-like glycosyltransferase
MERLAVVVPAYNEQETISRTLDALSSQADTSPHIIVVDNASTDDTANIVSDWYPNVTLLHEPTKGTGVAANTGFQYAIDDVGAKIILRTDADTVPAPDWAATGNHFLARKPHKQVITGSVRPLHDEHWRPYDNLALPASYTAYRLGVSVLQASTWPLRVLRGANMAIRRDAFDTVGGFPACSISEQDDDIELTKRIHGIFGFEALANVREMVVHTSMRRIRRIGYTGLVGYYLNFSAQTLAERRNELTNGEIDIR